MTKSITN